MYGCDIGHYAQNAQRVRDSGICGESQHGETVFKLDTEAILNRFCERGVNVSEWCRKHGCSRRGFYNIVYNKFVYGGGRKTRLIRSALAADGLLVETKKAFPERDDSSLAA